MSKVTADMSKYTLIDVPLAMNEARVIKVNGQELIAALGPLDFPRHIRVGLEQAPKGVASITMQFLYDVAPYEETTVLNVAGGGTIDTGVQSGRIMRITWPLSKEAVPRGKTKGRLRLVLQPFLDRIRALEDAAQHMSAEQRPTRRVAHYDLFSSKVLPGMEETIALKVRELRGEEVAV